MWPFRALTYLEKGGCLQLYSKYWCLFLPQLCKYTLYAWQLISFMLICSFPQSCDQILVWFFWKSVGERLIGSWGGIKWEIHLKSLHWHKRANSDPTPPWMPLSLILPTWKSYSEDHLSINLNNKTVVESYRRIKYFEKY